MRLKTAVIGCGRIGASPSSRWEGQVPAGWLPMSHAEALSSIRQVELVALCDSNELALNQAGEYYKISERYTDYRQLINKSKPAMISIATRTPLKSEIIKYACNNGVQGIYVEKPIANSIEDCVEILELIKKTGVKLGYGVNRRYHAAYRQAKELINQGEIGDLVEIVVEHGRSQLLWTHPHVVDLILFFFGSSDLLSVQSSIFSDSLQRQSDWVIDSDPVIENAFFRFKSGLSASITKSEGLNLRIGGSKGNMVIHGNGASIQINKKDSPVSPYYLNQSMIVPVIEKSATVTAMSELVDSISSRKEPPISSDHILSGIRMLMGCVWSHLNNGMRVDVSEIPENLFVTGRYGDLYA